MFPSLTPPLSCATVAASGKIIRESGELARAIIHKAQRAVPFFGQWPGQTIAWICRQVNDGDVA